MAYLVCILKDARRCWFREEERRIINNVPVYFPIFDDEVSKEVTLQYALEVRKRWRQNFGINCHITLERYGSFVEEDYSLPSATGDDRYAQHESRFVPLVGGGVDGLGYTVRYNPSRGWYCRADMVPSMAEHRDQETLWDSTPEGVVEKILAQWGIKNAVPFVDPEAARREEFERQQAAQQQQERRFAGLRPGDR